MDQLLCGNNNNNNNRCYYCIGSTGAFVGDHIKYNTDQLAAFGTPEELEMKFALDYRFGFIIPEDYVKKFADFLTEIRCSIYHANCEYIEGRYEYRCPIAAVCMSFESERSSRKRRRHRRNNNNAVILRTIEVRPCAANNGISKLILWQIVKCCEASGFDFVVDAPLRQTRDILDGINARLQESFSQPGERWRETPLGFIYDRRERESVLPFETFSILNVNHFKIARFLIKNPHPGYPKQALTLNVDAFPTAHVMTYGGTLDTTTTKSGGNEKPLLKICPMFFGKKRV